MAICGILPDLKLLKVHTERNGSCSACERKTVIVFMCAYLPSMKYFIRMHFFPRPLSLCVVIYALSNSISQLNHWSKFYHLESGRKTRTRLEGHNLRRTWLKFTSRGRKGGHHLLHCQHLIRSGIKHFVTVQTSDEAGMYNQCCFVRKRRCNNLIWC